MWQPIETFPEGHMQAVLLTDGVDVYFADIDAECPITGNLVYRVFGDEGDAARAFRASHPFTHWQPLPEPPA